MALLEKVSFNISVTNTNYCPHYTMCFINFVLAINITVVFFFKIKYFLGHIKIVCIFFFNYVLACQPYISNPFRNSKFL